MKQLWTPWRMEFILGEKEEGCIFCRKPEEASDEKNLILHRGKHNFVMLNLYPYTNGHLMVVPYRHTSDIEALEPEEMDDNWRLVQACVKILRKNMNPEGFNIGLNLGKAAGAGIDQHVHTHVVPRWNGDTNFMPVLSDVRLLPQHIMETWSLLVDDFNNLQ